MSVNPNEPVITPGEPKPEATPAAPTVADNQPALFKKAGGDWTKANESYFNAVNELQRVYAVAEQLAERTRQLEAGLTARGSQPANDDPLAIIQTELGLPVEPFAKAIDSRVKTNVEQILTDLFGPFMKQMEADEKLGAEIPDFEQLKGDARKFMRENPEVAETFNAVKAANPGAAWKYAIRETLVAKGAITQPAPVHAGLPGGGTPQGRAPVNPAGPDQATREKEAAEYLHNYGDSGPYRHERFKGTSVERAMQAARRQLGYEPGGENPQGW